MAKAKTSKSNPVVAQIVRAVMFIVSNLPLPLSLWLGKFVGYIMWRFKFAPARRTLVNLRLCFPTYSISERRSLARASLMETGITAFLGVSHLTWSQEKLSKYFGNVYGLEHVRDAMASEGGCVMLAPHMGSWELMSVYLSSLKLPLIALYRPPRIKELEALITQSRQRCGAELVPASPQGVRKLFKAAKQKKLVAMLPDQEPGLTGGVFAPFFGVPALTMTLASRITRKSGAKAVFAVTERNGLKYNFHFIPLDDAFYSDDINESVACLNAGIEKCIEISPVQYQWSYKRFRSRPKGMPYLYPRR